MKDKKSVSDTDNELIICIQINLHSPYKSIVMAEFVCPCDTRGLFSGKLASERPD